MHKYLFLLVFSGSCVALQPMPLVDQQHATVQASQKEQTRLTVLGDRIAHVFAPEGKLEIQTDEEKGQLFLRFQEEKPGPVTLTFVTESGLTQDITLKPVGKGFQRILFKPQGSAPKSSPPQTTAEKAATLLQKMVGGKVERLSLKRREEPEGFTLIPCLRTLDDGLEGQIFKIQNDTENSLSLDETLFFQKGDIALGLTGRHLKPQETALLFVIKRVKA